MRPLLMAASATPRRRQGRCLLLGLVMAGWAAAAVGQEIRASVELEPSPIGREEFAELRVVIEGSDTQGLYFDATFKLANLRRLGGPSQSTSIQIINGVPSSSRSLTWRLAPQAVGQARVFGIVVQVGDQEVELEDQTLDVQEEIPLDRQRRQRAADPFAGLFGEDPFEALRNRRRRPSSRYQAPDPKVFLYADVSPKEPFVGQQATYTLYLYTQVHLPSVNPEEVPDFKGFWSREIPQPDQLQPTMVEHQGEDYGRVVLLQRALFPRRGGTFELEPLRAHLTARVPERGPFGPILSRTTELTRSSNPVTVKVKPLPEAPPGFAGAVGRLTLDATLSPRELEVGDAATLTLTLAGRGHLQGLAAPALPEMAGIEVFPPQQVSDERIDGTTVRGSRTWSYVLVPKRPGQWEVPAIEVPYFDPQARSFEKATTATFPLHVRGATRVDPGDGETIALHSIRTAALPAATGSGHWRRLRPWLFGLPWVLAVALLVLRRRGDGHAHKAARRQLLDRLAAADATERPRQMAATVEDAWRDFLHARWDIPQGTPSTQWAALLAERGDLKNGDARALVELADDLHYLRYAPKLSDTEELRQQLLERSRRLARKVR